MEPTINEAIVKSVNCGNFQLWLQNHNFYSYKGDNIWLSCPSIVQVFGHALCKGRGKNLYDTDETEKFSDVHAPGLFKEIFETILNDDKLSSINRCNLQRIRVVTLLHNSASLEIRYGPHFFETNTMIKLLACTIIEFNHTEG